METQHVFVILSSENYPEEIVWEGVIEVNDKTVDDIAKDVLIPIGNNLVSQMDVQNPGVLGAFDETNKVFKLFLAEELVGTLRVVTNFEEVLEINSMEIGSMLASLESRFPGYRLSFVARHETDSSKHVIISSEEELGELSQAIDEYIGDAEVIETVLQETIKFPTSGIEPLAAEGAKSEDPNT